MSVDFAVCISLVCSSLLAAPALAQPSRLAVLQADDRRAATAADLATLRAGTHSGDPQTARVAVRAIGRLERPAVIPDILPLLRHAQVEVRAEAANAIGQAAQGWKKDKPSGAAMDTAQAALIARLKIEADLEPRQAIAETIGRLPYATEAQAAAAELALLDLLLRFDAVTDRLGVAKGFEALTRVSRQVRPISADAIAALKRLAVPGGADSATGARVRRLALEALITASAADEELATAATHDSDAQVRRIALRPAPLTALQMALNDQSAAVRYEALRLVKVKSAPTSCAASISAVGDRDSHVALLALDQLAACASFPDALQLLDRAVTDLSDAASPRGWHRAAHALVALATASPERGAAVLGQFTASRTWQLRMYAARAAAVLKNRDVLERLARDDDDNVAEAAVDALRREVGHDADAVYISALTRRGNQIVRAAALALVDTPHADTALPALTAAQQRIDAEGTDNSHDARDAIAKALGARAGRAGGAGKPITSELNAEDLRRLASPRARVTIRGVGTFELALFTIEAPASVLRFARLAEAGYYNGLTFHRVVANFVVQGGSPGASEYVGDARFMRDELGLWPHVRGAVGISTRGRDTGDAQIFIDLVDNPRLDHEYTVFAQVLNGIEVVDQILEGDVIERIDIIP